MREGCDDTFDLVRSAQVDWAYLDACPCAPVFRTALFADLMAAFVVLDFLRLAFFMIPPVPRFVQLGSFLDSAKPPPKKQSPANVGPRPMMAQALGHCLGFEESFPLGEPAR